MSNGEWFPERPPVVELDRYEPAPRRADRARRAARRLAPVAAVLVGSLVIVGSVWQVADAVWKKADPAPVVLPNTFPSTAAPRTPAPYPFGRYKPTTHKPSPTGVPRNGTLLVGKQVRPGLYRTRVAPAYLAGREDNGYCYVSRLNTTTPNLGAVRTSYDEVPTGPIIAQAMYRTTGQRVTLRVLPTDKAVEVYCGDAVWERVTR